MKLTILGTGNAVVTKCYNTCFILENNQDYLLVDAGGGNQILSQLEKINVNWKDIHHIIVTHKHIDHIMGMVWLLRLYLQNLSRGMEIDDVYIYGHDVVVETLDTLAHLLLTPKETKYLNTKVHLVEVKHDETIQLLDHDITFFDIESTKEKQFGFTMVNPDTKFKLTCLGDEPYNPHNEAYALNSDWLLHEAFCLYADRERFQPYKKAHTTPKEAGENATALHAKNLILYHTEDKTFATRKETYTNEAKQYFSGNVYVPWDLESFDL